MFKLTLLFLVSYLALAFACSAISTRVHKNATEDFWFSGMIGWVKPDTTGTLEFVHNLDGIIHYTFYTAYCLYTFTDTNAKLFNAILLSE